MYKSDAHGLFQDDLLEDIASQNDLLLELTSGLPAHEIDQLNRRLDLAVRLVEWFADSVRN
jgi:hypothetical protein